MRNDFCLWRKVSQSFSYSPTATKNVLQEVRGISSNIISTPYNKTVLREKLQVEFVCTYHRAIIKVPKKTHLRYSTIFNLLISRMVSKPRKLRLKEKRSR